MFDLYFENSCIRLGSCRSYFRLLKEKLLCKIYFEKKTENTFRKNKNLKYLFAFVTENNYIIIMYLFMFYFYIKKYLILIKINSQYCFMVNEQKYHRDICWPFRLIHCLFDLPSFIFIGSSLLYNISCSVSNCLCLLKAV